MLGDPKLERALSEKKLKEVTSISAYTCDYANYKFDSSGYVIMNGTSREFISAESLERHRAELYKTIVLELRSSFAAIKAAVADDPVRLNAFIISKCDSAIDMTNGVL